MARYESKFERRGDNRLPFWKQKDDVREGYHKVTQIFKPNKYPSATLQTGEFKLGFGQELWEKEIAADLRKCFAEGKAAHIEVSRGQATLVCPSEEFTATWERTEFGAKTVYDESEPVYKPFNRPQSVNDDSIPF